MANPWLRALRALPWAALLTKAPELARAADTVLSGTRSRQATSAAVDQLRNLTDRIEALENHDRLGAELVYNAVEFAGEALVVSRKSVEK